MTRSRFARSVIGFAVAALFILVAQPPQSAEARERRPPPKTKKAEAVTKPVYEKLTAAHEFLNSEPPNYAGAVKLLGELDASEKLNNHERSLVWQTYGYLYAGQEKYPQAIRAFRKCLELGGLPEATALNTKYNLAQLFLVTEQYDQGIATLKEWFEVAQNPGPQAYFMMANAYAQKEDYRSALQWAKDGLEQADAPKESWIRLVMQLHLTLEEYAEARPYLEQLMSQWPKKAYAVQLAAVYGETKQDQKSLMMLEMAYLAGWLEKTKELERLCQMYLYHEMPYKCAVMGTRHLADGSMESTKKNWELVANAWTLSQEYDDALAPLGKAAELSDDGELWVRLGQIYIDREDWQNAEKSIRRGISKGGLKDAGRAQLLVGITHYNRDNYGDAREWFDRARKHKTTRKDANDWLRALKQRRDVRAGGE